MLKKIFPLILALFFLTGCAVNMPSPITGTPVSRSSTQQVLDDVMEAFETSNDPLPLPILHNMTITEKEMFEPSTGAYIGAWLSHDMPIRLFQHSANKQHAVFVHEMFLGETVPETWLLENIAAMSTPFIVLQFDEWRLQENIFDAIITLAEDLGRFNLPLFLAFFPPGHDLRPSEYNIIFRFARSVFLNHAPQVAFVWVAENYNSTPENTFYPGHDVVDWVAVSLLAERDVSGEKLDIFAKLQTFHSNFQAHKPISILPLGISHFKRGDYYFYVDETADAILNTYELLRSFPRVGMIVYGDVLAISPQNSNDFSISNDPLLFTAYQEAINHEFFLSNINTNSEPSPTWLRSSYHGYFWEDNIYISTLFLENVKKMTPLRGVREINGEGYVNQNQLPLLNISFCTLKNALTVNN